MSAGAGVSRRDQSVVLFTEAEHVVLSRWFEEKENGRFCTGGEEMERALESMGIADVNFDDYHGSVDVAVARIVLETDESLLPNWFCTEADGTEVSTGTEGGVYFGSGFQQFEYHNDPEKTKAGRLANGWSTLGDIGRVDDDGFLYLTDRKANMIISGGVNIYPQEAENILTVHPKVADVAVFGVPNEDFGEEVKAVVQLVDASDAGADLERELITYCREHLADVKCPRSVDFRDELPRHPTGKLYKRILKDEYWKGHQTRVL